MAAPLDPSRPIATISLPGRGRPGAREDLILRALKRYQSGGQYTSATVKRLRSAGIKQPLFANSAARDLWKQGGGS